MAQSPSASMDRDSAMGDILDEDLDEEGPMIWQSVALEHENRPSADDQQHNQHRQPTSTRRWLAGLFGPKSDEAMSFQDEWRVDVEPHQYDDEPASLTGLYAEGMHPLSYHIASSGISSEAPYIMQGLQ